MRYKNRLDEHIAMFIKSEYIKNGKNASKTAKKIGIDRQTLDNLLKKFNIQPRIKTVTDDIHKPLVAALTSVGMSENTLYKKCKSNETMYKYFCFIYLYCVKFVTLKGISEKYNITNHKMLEKINKYKDLIKNKRDIRVAYELFIIKIKQNEI